MGQRHHALTKHPTGCFDGSWVSLKTRCLISTFVEAITRQAEAERKGHARIIKPEGEQPDTPSVGAVVTKPLDIDV